MNIYRDGFMLKGKEGAKWRYCKWVSESVVAVAVFVCFEQSLQQRRKGEG